MDYVSERPLLVRPVEPGRMLLMPLVKLGANQDVGDPQGRVGPCIDGG